jgi:hypothetical protein
MPRPYWNRSWRERRRAEARRAAALGSNPPVRPRDRGRCPAADRARACSTALHSRNSFSRRRSMHFRNASVHRHCACVSAGRAPGAATHPSELQSYGPHLREWPTSRSGPPGSRAPRCFLAPQCAGRFPRSPRSVRPAAAQLLTAALALVWGAHRMVCDQPHSASSGLHRHHPRSSDFERSRGPSSTSRSIPSAWSRATPA